MQASQLHPHLDAIFKAGLDRVDPFNMIMDHVRLENNCLEIAFESQTRRVDLAGLSQIYILGAGKATAPMARAFETILGDRKGSFPLNTATPLP